MTAVTLTVNGRRRSAEVEPRTHLADLLREKHNLTGTHLGCEHGVCGACTVMLDGAPARACITYAVACENAEVTTIEGLDDDEIAGELRKAFTREHGLQCGYCTPGMIVSARDLVLRLDRPSEHDVRVAMSGNLCRCTGYVGIVRAIESVIADRRARGIACVPDGGRKRLGPAGSGNAAASTAPDRRAPSKPKNAPPAPSARAADKQKLDDAWAPQATLKQSFDVSHPADKVWAFFGRIRDVAACLPGASLDEVTGGGRVEGRIRVKVGPISAEFEGAADVTRDETARAGTINGAGRDRKSNSATRGLIRYAVREAEGGGSRVEVEIGYALTGMLAQFGRSGLVQDVANRLTAAFVQNLEARLGSGADGPAGGAPPAVASELDAGSLIVGVVRGWFRSLFAKLLRRR